MRCKTPFRILFLTVARRWSLAAALVLAASFLPARADAQPQPNIVVVYTDDLAIRLMEYLPDVKALIAGQGLEMQATSPAALCAPGRASFLTGKYAHNHGVFSNGFGEAAFRYYGNEGHTFADWAQQVGYTTGYFGKYINGYGGETAHVPPGWDRWVSYRTGSLDRYALTTVEDNGQDRSVTGVYDTDFMAAQATAFVATAPEPFLAMFAPLSPHGPFVSAIRHRGAFDSTPINLPPSFLGNAEEQSDFIRLRLEMMLSVKEAIQALLDALTVRGVLDNTYIFFTADNGAFMGEHGFTNGKGEPYEESAQVPFYVRGPGVPVGKRETLVADQDFAPTVAELMGAPIPLDLDGRSLVPLLHGAVNETSRQRVLLQLQSLVGWWRAVRTPIRMYVDRDDGTCEMYRFDRDPYELRNRGCKSRRGKLLSAFTTRLSTCAAAECGAIEDECQPRDRRCKRGLLQ